MVRFNPQLRKEIEKYLNYSIIVEGKKDIDSLNKLGFERVYAIHQTGVSLRESAEKIAEEIGRKEKVCILTDLDKRGKTLYMQIKTIFQELGLRLDSSLRGILIKSGVSHIEGLDSFMKKIDNIY